MTVFGGMIVLSAIFAQSFIIVNFPFFKSSAGFLIIRTQPNTNDDTILPDLNMVPNGCSFDDTVGSDVYMVTYFHGIVIEVSAIRFVWWPRCDIYRGKGVMVGWHTSLRIPPQQDNIVPGR
jgi:hypothetical protein